MWWIALFDGRWCCLHFNLVRKSQKIRRNCQSSGWRKRCEILSRRLSIVGLAALLVRDGETTIEIDFVFLSGGCWGQRRKSSPNAVFLGKRHDNKVLNSKNLLSIIDLLMSLLEGSFSTMAGARKLPISVNGAFPLLNGPFANLNGPFPQMP